MGAFARPAKDSKNRKFFNWAHWTLGSCLILGASNVITGTLNYKVWWNNCTAPTLQWISVGVIASFVLAALVLESLKLCRPMKPKTWKTEMGAPTPRPQKKGGKVRSIRTKEAAGTNSPAPSTDPSS